MYKRESTNKAINYEMSAHNGLTMEMLTHTETGPLDRLSAIILTHHMMLAGYIGKRPFIRKYQSYTKNSLKKMARGGGKSMKPLSTKEWTSVSKSE